MGFGGGGFFGGGAKQAETNTNSQQSGFSEVDGPVTSLNLNLGQGKNSSAVINMLDGGAVLGGLDVAKEALKQIAAAQKNAGDSVNSQVSQAYALANQARQSETSGAINNVLKYGAIVVGIALAAWALVKSK